MALPALASLRRPRLLFACALLLLASQVWLMIICCSRCARYAGDEWKKYCPNYRLARRILSV